MSWAVRRINGGRAVRSDDTPPPGWVAVYVTCLQSGWKDVVRRAEWYHVPDSATLEGLLVQIFGIERTQRLFENDSLHLLPVSGDAYPPSPHKSVVLQEGDALDIRISSAEWYSMTHNNEESISCGS